MDAIVCVDANWGIGYNNGLLFHLPEDMKFFKKQTTGNYVVMGRKTFESIGKPLENRRSIIITSKPLDMMNKYVALYPDRFHDMMFMTKEEFDTKILERQNEFSNLYLIGGESMYKAYADQVDTYYITQVAKAAQLVDAWFERPRIGDFKYVELERGTSLGIDYIITKWTRVKKK